MPDIIIIFGNTTVEKTVLVTTLKIYNVSVSVCVCVGDGKNFSHTKGSLYCTVVTERYSLLSEHFVGLSLGRWR